MSDENPEEVKKERDALHGTVHEFVDHVQKLMDEIEELKKTQCACKRKSADEKCSS